MLHRVNPPACLDDMKKLLRYQRKFLALLITKKNPLRKPEFELWFGEPLGRWSWSRAYRAGKPTKKLGKHIEPVVQYADTHPLEVREILTTIKHDHAFAYKRNNPNFQFKFDHLSSGWKEVLEPFFLAFYELLHKPGYKAEPFGFATKLDWRAFMNAQYKANPYVCPYCDDKQGDYTQKIDANDAEHWLPKSQYPHLSIHWANLFRTCMECNERFKGDDSPIKHQGCGELNKTYHPYDRPALDSAQVVAELKPTNPSLYQLKLADSTHPFCASTLDELLSLSERWSNRIKTTLQRDKSALVAERIYTANRCNTPINATWLKEELEDAAEFRKRKIGVEENMLLESAVLDFQANSEVDEIYFSLGSTHGFAHR